ncbi:protein of unknown function [Paraburkholderia kururiensis]
MRRRPHDAPRALENHDGDEDRENRVDRRPARQQNHARGHDGRHRAQHVAQHMQPCPAQIEVFAVAAVKNEKRDHVRRKTRNRHDHHRLACNGHGRGEPLHGLDHDPRGNDEERAAIHERSENFEPFVAVGKLRGSGALAVVNGDPAEAERGGVADHVAGVGEQRERAGNQAAHHLHHHEQRNDDERPADAMLVRDAVQMVVTGVAVVVAAMAMAVAVIVIVVMIRMVVRMIVAVRVWMCHGRVAWLNWRSGHYIHI